MTVRVLVSDSSDFAERLRRLAPNLAVDVIADSKRNLLETARNLRPNLIVLDARHSDALDMLSLLKTQRETRDIPVVVLTDDESAATNELALDLGAEGAVSLPLTEEMVPRLLALVG